MICLNCSHFDFNDYLHGYGTCEPLDEDFRADTECKCPESELKLIASLQEERHLHAAGTVCELSEVIGRRR